MKSVPVGNVRAEQGALPQQRRAALRVLCRKRSDDMQFFSTRDTNRKVTSSEAIAQGLSDEGGLFVPESFPQVDVRTLCELQAKYLLKQSSLSLIIKILLKLLLLTKVAE